MQGSPLKVAISEVLQPTLGVTEQVLAVHKLVIQDDGNPLILLIDEESELGAYYVYFGVEDEPYYFVVVIRQESNELVASAAYIEAAVRVYLSIRSATRDIVKSGVWETVRQPSFHSDSRSLFSPLLRGCHQ